MKSRFRYGLINRVGFYVGYFLRKTISLWFEVRKPKIKMFLYEMMYSARKLLGPNALMPSPFGTDLVETRFGRFRVRPHTVDMSNVSPAFERSDIKYLLGLMARFRNEDKSVLFLDVGADLGTFTVTVGNSLKGYDGIKIMAFEPAPSSFTLLEENIGLNGLGDVTHTYKIALWSEEAGELGFRFNPRTPGSSGLLIEGEESFRVKAGTVDNILGDDAGRYDAIVIKMDVEGVESEVLKGARKTLDSAREVYLLVEDFINPEVIHHLENIGAEFITKLTPYNSWWSIKRPKH
jgi:FkbM family methyltransferase